MGTRGRLKRLKPWHLDVTNEQQLLGMLAREFMMTPASMRSKLAEFGIQVGPGATVGEIYEQGKADKFREFLFARGVDTIIMPSENGESGSVQWKRDEDNESYRQDKVKGARAKASSPGFEKGPAQAKKPAPHVTLDQVIAADLSSVKVNTDSLFEEIFGNIFTGMFGQVPPMGPVELSNMIFAVERVRLVFHFEGGVRKFEYAKRKMAKTKTIADLVENINLHIKAASPGFTGDSKTLKFSIVVPDGRLIPVKGGSFSAFHLRLEQVRWP